MRVEQRWTMRSLVARFFPVGLFLSVMLGISGCAGILGKSHQTGGGNPPPTTLAVSSPAAGSVSATTAKITWTTNIPADSQVEYGLTISYGTSSVLDPAMVMAHSVPLTALAPSTAYHFRVKSHDSSGDTATSNDVVLTTAAAPDTTPPSVSITAPSAGATLSGTITLSANASDNVGVTSVQFRVDGGNTGSALNALPYSLSFDTHLVANGSHTFSAVAKDAAGNSAPSAGVSVTISNSTALDTMPPSVPSGLNAIAVSSSQINLSWTASTDNVGVTGYKVFRGASQVGTASVNSFQDAGLAASTPFSYTVSAFDAAGNNSAQSASVSATTLGSSGGRVIEIFPSDANASCNEQFENLANTLAPGDTLILHGGIYTQSCRRLISNIHGTPSSPITIQAAAGENPIITRPDASQNNIEIQSVSYLTISGLHFLGGDSGVRLMSGDHITFADNEIYNTDNNALRVNDSNMDSLTIRHNHIHHTGLDTTSLTEGEGMYLGCNNDACHITNSLIVGNYIHHTRGTSSGGNDGIELKVGSFNNIIRDNVIHDTNIGEQFPCITVYGGGSSINTIEGNAVWNCGEGIYIVSDAVVRNNIVFSSGSGISSYPHVQVATMKNLTIVNNTIYSNSDCLFLRWGSVTNFTLANNAAYCAGNNAVNVSSFGGATVKSNFVEGGMSGASIDNNAFLAGGTAASAFNDPVNLDFWPKASSPLLGRANASFIPPLDFNGTPRMAPFDVGAYETEGLAQNPGWRITTDFKPSTIP
jgi:chitodextrinase